ncbi:hypothetical protein Hanom_Chr07g00587351 [Helianthus anomalus]
MYEVGKGNKIRRAIKEEKYDARKAILPMLQAEEDERFAKEWKRYLEEEASIMKDGCLLQPVRCDQRFGKAMVLL